MKTKFLLLFFFATQIFYAQDITGIWYGNIEVRSQKLPLVVHIEKDGDGYKSTFDSPLQGAKGIPIDATTFKDNILKLEVSKINFVYKGTYNDEKIEGTLVQNGMSLPLIFTRNDNAEVTNRLQTPKAPFNYETEDVTFKSESDGNVLAGTIAEPKNFDKSKPILVMITGSGAQNRDEELFGHKLFLVISDNLAKKGIATLRLDDRGTGSSERGKDGATAADFATDINSAVNYLIKNGYKNIGLIGHSEGGMIAPMVANLNKNVKFLVLLAGPGIPVEDLLLKQTHDLAKSSGATDESLQATGALNRKIYRYVNDYKGENLETDVRSFLITELQKLPGDKMPLDKIEEIANAQATKISSPWFRYFLNFNPDLYLSKFKIPVLAINGSLDLQVSAKENLEGIKSSLTKAGNKNFETLEFNGLNHLLQTATTGNPSEYGQIEETISPKVLDKVSSWILSLK